MAPNRLESGQLTPEGARTAAYLFTTYGARLYAYFRFMLDDDGAALRVLSDTVVGAAAENRVPDPDESAERIFTLARTECRRHQHVAAMSAGSRWPGTGPGSGVRLDLPEIARLAVSRLSPAIREAFVLAAPHNDLSLPDLAKVMSMNLEEAADLRAKAGLDFVRSLALCAEEAGYTTYSGAELRRRAEASLARDAEEKPPSLPALDDLALAPFREHGEEPPAARDALPIPAPVPVPAVRPTVPNERPALTDGYPALAGGQTGRLDGELGCRPDDYGPPDYGSAGLAFGRRFATQITGQFSMLTGPMQAAGDRVLGDRAARHRKLALAGAGGIAVVAVTAIALQALVPGGNDTITLTHGSVPAVSVLPSGGPTVTGTSPLAGRPPSARPEGGQPSAARDAAAPAGGYPAPAHQASGSGTGTTPSTQPSAHPNPQPTATKTTKPSPKPTSSQSSPPASSPSTGSPSPNPGSTSPSPGTT